MIFKFGDTPVLCRYRDKLHVGNIIRVSLLSKKIFFPDQGLFHPIILPLSPLSISPPFRPPPSLFPPPPLIFFFEILRIFLRIFPGKNIHPRLRTHKKIVRIFLRPHACAVATFRKGVRAIQLVGRASESLFLHLSFLSLWIDVFPSSHISLSINLNPFPVYSTSLCFPFIFSPPCNPHLCFIFFRYVGNSSGAFDGKKNLCSSLKFGWWNRKVQMRPMAVQFILPVLFLPLSPPDSSPSPPFLLVK